MKFTKEEARQKLADEFSKKVENIGAWERTINENVETLFSLLGENDSLTIEDFVAKAIPLLDTSAGHIRKETSDLAKKYEEKIKDIEKVNKKKEPEKNLEDNDAFKALLEKVTALENKRREEESAKVISEKRSAIAAKIKESGVKNETWIDAILEKVSIKEDSDVDAEAKSFVEMYNLMSTTTPKNITPRKSTGSAAEDVQEAIKAAAEYAKTQRLAD